MRTTRKSRTKDECIAARRRLRPPPALRRPPERVSGEVSSMANENKRDYYEVLGVEKDATARRYQARLPQACRAVSSGREPRSRARRKNSRRSTRPYEVLSDPDKRARYDQYGFAGVDPNFNPNAGGSPFGGGRLRRLRRPRRYFRQLFRRRPQHAPQRQRAPCRATTSARSVELTL